MLKTKPRLTYQGITIILSNPSRFDKLALLSGPAGQVMSDYCLRPEFNIMQCEVRLMEDESPFLPGTKVAIVCGEAAMHKWLPETKGNTLNEMRGSPFFSHGVYFIPTFVPQDAADFKGYEQQLNPLSKDYQPDANEYDSDDGEGDVKRHGKTARRNYAFWLRADVRKAKKIVKNDGKLPTLPYQQPVYHIYPSSSVVIDVLNSVVAGSFLWFDMETDYEEANMQCFAFSVDGINYYAVPILDNAYKPAYSNTHKILQALALAISKTVVVAHNGACFDYLVLAFKCRIAVRNAYDSMVAFHRCYPDVEKSLGHAVSLFTFEKFHKDENSVGYTTRQQMMDRLSYCGKDVYTMYLVHQEITKYAATIPGLTDCINVAMASIRPYVTVALQGIRYDPEKVRATMAENDTAMEQYMRICNLLIGPSGMIDVRKSVKNGKTKAFPNSNKQCIEYFHNLLGYPVVARSKKTGNPSLGKLAIFKLALRHDNPVLRFVIAFRETSKESSKLKFVPWKDDNNEVYKDSQGSPNSEKPHTETPVTGSKEIPLNLSFSRV